MDCKVITSENPDVYNNMGKVTTKKYLNATLNSDGTIAYSGYSDTQITFTDSFDIRGNAIDQTTYEAFNDLGSYDRTKLDSADASYNVGQKRVIHNSLYDIHDRVKQSTVTTYSSQREFVSRQEITYGDYDKFDNVLHQVINTYVKDPNNVGADVLYEHKTIDNDYTLNIQSADSSIFTADGVTKTFTLTYPLTGKTYDVYVNGELKVKGTEIGRASCRERV